MSHNSNCSSSLYRFLEQIDLDTVNAAQAVPCAHCEVSSIEQTLSVKRVGQTSIQKRRWLGIHCVVGWLDAASALPATLCGLWAARCIWGSLSYLRVPFQRTAKYLVFIV